MKDYHVDIVKRGEQLPELSERNFFHSPELFHVLERVTGCSPYMVVVSDGGGTVHAHLLAILWLPRLSYAALSVLSGTCLWRGRVSR